MEKIKKVTVPVQGEAQAQKRPNKTLSLYLRLILSKEPATTTTATPQTKTTNKIWQTQKSGEPDFQNYILDLFVFNKKSQSIQRIQKVWPKEEKKISTQIVPKKDVMADLLDKDLFGLKDAQKLQ